MLLSRSQSVVDAVRSIGVTLFTYHRWRKERAFVRHWSEDNGECGLKMNQVQRLKELERENERLRKAVSDLTLEKLILTEAVSGTS